VIGYWDPTSDIVYDSYQTVRQNRQALTDWITGHVNRIQSDEDPELRKTFVHFWLKNGGAGPTFREKDVVFECFHNFLAFNQWGNMLYNIMYQLTDGPSLPGLIPYEPKIKACFAETMEHPDERDDCAFTRLDRFVMELFRWISPNGGSLSSLTKIVPPPNHPIQPLTSKIISQHPAANREAIHWTNPDVFWPDRYLTAPTSDQNDEAKCKQIGLSGCPFSKEAFAVKDGRQAEVTNSAFGTVYSVAEGVMYPVLDDAGYAPFGFGYRRCPGELLTINVMKEFLRKVWQDKLSFKQFDKPSPEKFPVGPITVVSDIIGFTNPS